MISIELRATDTLFFGPGVPFAAEGIQVDVPGVFPPYPATLVGAIRAWLARSQGWSGRGRWPSRLNPVLGDGPANLGALQFSGPYLLRDGERLFPVPSCVLGSTQLGDGAVSPWLPVASLRPGPPVRCDLGADVRLPVIDRPHKGRGRLRPGHGLWLTRAGLQAVLCGELPAAVDIVAAEELWRDERRVGIERDRESRSAKEGMLYSCRHVRLASNVGLGLRVRGVPGDWEPTLFRERTLSLGGESRTATCERWSEDSGGMNDTNVDRGDPSGRVMLVSLTPIDLGKSLVPGENLLGEHGGVRIISACIGRALRIGGWNSLEHRSLPLRTHLPPGTVIFGEAIEPRRLRAACAENGGIVSIGDQQPWGFGEVALATWTDNNVKEER